MEPRVWSKRSGAERAPEGAIDVCRPSKWGNPFREGVDGTRAEVVDKHAVWLVSGGGKRLLADIEELRGKHLVCWCAPKACHADILLRLANRSTTPSYVCAQCGEQLDDENVAMEGGVGKYCCFEEV